jgi:hypothetical protein
MTASTPITSKPYPVTKSAPPKGSQSSQDSKMPPRGPSNLIVRSSNPLPVPKDTKSQ